MRLPSYRKHLSGQARATIGGVEHLLGRYGSPESKETYGRLIAEYTASNCSASFAKAGNRSVPLVVALPAASRCSYWRCCTLTIA